jgi:hypothetical protein
MHRDGEKQRTHRHYLKSSVYCGRCGSRFCLTNAKGKYLYFFCVGRQQKRTDCDLPYSPAAEVEPAVERYYTTVRLPEDLQQTIREGLRSELDQQRSQAEPEISYARKRVTELDDERRRLARGVVTGAIPEDLAREEQDRITKDLGQAQRILGTAEVVFAKIADTLERALALVGRYDEVYRLGGPEVRRLSNRFFFEKLLIDVDEDDKAAAVAGAVLREPWATLLADDYHSHMIANTKSLGHLSDDRGSKQMSIVPPAVLWLRTSETGVSRHRKHLWV